MSYDSGDHHAMIRKTLSENKGRGGQIILRKKKKQTGFLFSLEGEIVNRRGQRAAEPFCPNTSIQADNLRNRIHALKPQYYIQTFLGSRFPSSKMLIATRQTIQQRVRNEIDLFCLGAIMNLPSEVKQSSPAAIHALLCWYCSPPSPSSDLHIIHSRKEYFKSRSVPIHTVWNTYLSVSWGLGDKNRL